MSESQEMTIQRGQEVEENGLTTTRSESAELSTASDSAAAQAEIQSALVLANRFPRNEDTAFQKLMRACNRTTFAQGASYSFPRGGAKVTGPSVNLAREAARVWGNIRYGIEVVRDDTATRKIRGWAWDLQTNTKVAAEDEFAKLIQRKGKGWIVPDERDLRELTNRRGAILVRNCILQLLPYDLIEDAANTALQTLRADSAKDPDGQRKQLLASFDALNVSAEQIEKYLGHPIKEASPAQLADLRQVWKSISDGNSTWAEYMPKEAPGKDVSVEDLVKTKEESKPVDPEVLPAEEVAEESDDAEAEIEDVPDDPEKLSSAAVARLFTQLEKKGYSIDALEDQVEMPIGDVPASRELELLRMVEKLPKLPKPGRGA